MDPITSLIYQIIAIFGFPTAFEIVFGLIISLILYLLDRAEKKRQEEALKRQDESLDIILEQVSKVNIFQTKTLSLAIESLGKDFDNFRNDIEEIKSSIGVNNNKNRQLKPISVDEQATSRSEPISRDPIVSLSTNFGNLLSSQVNSFIGQIKNNLSNLNKINTMDKSDLRKAKKGLEFDIKDLFNIQTMLNDMKTEKSSDQFESAEQSESVESTATAENFLPLNKENDQQHENQEKLVQKDVFKVQGMNIGELEEQLENLQSIPEIVKFTESILKKFEDSENFEPRSGTDSSKSKSERKKIKPTKTISKSEFEQNE